MAALPPAQAPLFELPPTTPGECFASGHLLRVLAARREREGTPSTDPKCMPCPLCGAVWVFAAEEGASA